MIVSLCRARKITEASALNLCCCAPNRVSWSMNQRVVLLLMQAARRVSRPRRLGTEIKMSLRSNPLELVDELKIALLLMQAASFICVASQQTA
jgi:hypothetical protein